MTPTISSNAVKTDMQLAQRAPVRAYKPRKEGPMISDTSGYASFGSTSQNRSRPVLMPTRHSFHIINSGHSGLSQKRGQLQRPLSASCPSVTDRIVSA